jgi:hypothetical protein
MNTPDNRPPAPPGVPWLGGTQTRASTASPPTPPTPPRMESQSERGVGLPFRMSASARARVARKSVVWVELVENKHWRGLAANQSSAASTQLGGVHGAMPTSQRSARGAMGAQPGTARGKAVRPDAQQARQQRALARHERKVLGWWAALNPGQRVAPHKLRDISRACRLSYPIAAATLRRLCWRHVVVRDRGRWSFWFAPGIDPVRTLQLALLHAPPS